MARQLLFFTSSLAFLLFGGFISDSPVLNNNIVAMPMSIHANFERKIRVAIFTRQSFVKVRFKKGLELFDSDSGATLASFHATDSPVTIYRHRSRMFYKVGKIRKSIKRTSSLVMISENNLLRINRRNFAGTITVKKASSGMHVVNHVGLERYLGSVLSKEIPALWPLDSLKAQAVAARTYALHKMKRSKRNSYDILATVDDQVFGGAVKIPSSIKRAVTETRGLILSFDGEPIPAYYHAHSGGYTELPKNVWGRSLEYFESVEDPYCTKYRITNWTHKASPLKIARKLAKQGVATGRITNMRIASRLNESGRNRTIVLETETGEQKLSATTFRRLMGYSSIKSTMFTIHRTAKGFLFRGKGYGHGVGLSQWGARGMAEAGIKWKKILSHYYPLTTLLKIY